MPCDADLLALLPRWLPPDAVWQSTLIGREEIWPVHRKTAELAACARRAGRELASPDAARALGLREAPMR